MKIVERIINLKPNSFYLGNDSFSLARTMPDSKSVEYSIYSYYNRSYILMSNFIENKKSSLIKICEDQCFVRNGMKKVLAFNKNNGDLLWSIEYGFGQDRYIDNEIFIYSDFNVKKTKLTKEDRLIWESENSFLFPFRHNNTIFHYSRYNKNDDGEYIDRTILDSSLITSGDILFSISLRSILLEDSKKQDFGIQNILGVYKETIWLNCSSNHLIGANVNTGEIEHVFHDLSPELNYLHDNRSVLPMDKNTCFLIEEEGKIVGINLNQYWELDLDTATFNFIELRSKSNRSINAVKPVITKKYAWFRNANQGTLVKFNRDTKEVVEYTNSDLHPRLKRFHDFKVNDDFLYVSDMTLGSKTSDLFIFEVEEDEVKKDKIGLARYLYQSEYFIDMPDCINDENSYVNIIRKACEVSRGYLELGDISASTEEQQFVYKLEVNKTDYILSIDIQSHFVNPAIINDLNDILKDQYPDSDYCFFNLFGPEVDFGIAFSKREMALKLIEDGIIDRNMNTEIT